MSRLPIRLRVAAAFAATMALVLAATGVLLYVRLGHDLSLALDRDLRLRADDLTTLVERSVDLRGGNDALIERGESFAQLLTPAGRVLDASSTVEGRALLDPGELSLAAQGPRFFDRSSVPGLDEPARLFAVPVVRGGAPLVLVVGATAEDKAEALRDLRDELALLLPLALLVATGSGYLLSGAGLRAVEAMRRRAAEITAERPGERLPVAPTGDELERLGNTLNDMLARLEHAFQRERGFVAEASHELRTPLALLRAELDFALRHAADEDELREAVRNASDETDRLVQLSEGLLLVASGDEGALPLRREPIPAAELLESVRNRFLWRATEAKRVIDLEAAGDLVVAGDRLRLEQALSNLVDNALRHGDGAVRLDVREVGDTTELHVRDRGRGFPDDFLPRAFERFSRPHEGRSAPGAGLGLAIVQAIARAHGGSAHAENRSGGGVDAWLSLPGSGD
jgi:signal transduction histidine kinase